MLQNHDVDPGCPVTDVLSCQLESPGENRQRRGWLGESVGSICLGPIWIVVSTPDQIIP